MATLTVNVDDKVKASADALYKSLGLNMTTAVNAFLRASLREGGIPFSLTTGVRGPWVDPATAYVPPRSADGTPILPASWDDEEDAVYDGLYS